MATNETTLSYRWPQGSVVTRVDVRQQSDGNAVAYLYADEQEETRTIRQELRSALRLKGWGTLSDYREGAYALRISGFSSADELLALLQEGGFVSEPAHTAQLNPSQPPLSFADKMRSNSLRASGIFYSAGNLVYLASGLLRGREDFKRTGEKNNQSGQIGSALLWGAGDLLIAGLGGRDETQQYNSLLGKLQRHYQQQGIEIPKNAALYAETSKRDASFSTKTKDFLVDHLNQIKCASEALAAIFYYKAGKQQGNVAKQITAVIFGLGFSASGLIPERKIDPQAYENASGWKKLWMKIQSRPLMIGGVSGYSNTILTTYSAHQEGKRYQDMQKNPHLYQGDTKRPSKYYQLDYAAPGIMFFGNSLYAMSKKNGTGIRTDAKIDDIYIVAAQILNKQPEELREAAIASTVKFLGERPEIKDAAPEITVRLRQQMEVQRNSPWFEKRPLAAYTPTPKKRGLRETADAAPRHEPATTVEKAEAVHIAPTPQRTSERA